MEEAIRALTEACRERAFSWALEYSEAENTFYAYAKGIGAGEYFEVKRVPDPKRALEQLLERLPKYPRR